MQSNVSQRVMLFNRNSSLQYGPIGYDDDGVVIGCEIKSSRYGMVPSSIGQISVTSEFLGPACGPCCKERDWYITFFIASFTVTGPYCKE